MFSHPCINRQTITTFTEAHRYRSIREAISVFPRVASIAVLITSGLVQNCMAQMAALPQPVFTLKDENSVDLLTFNTYLTLTDTSIGSKEHPLTHTIQSGPDGKWSLQSGTGTAVAEVTDTFFASLVWSSSNRAVCNPNQPSTLGVYLNGASEYFQGCITYPQPFRSGSTLIFNADGTYHYTLRDGTVVVFTGTPQNQNSYNPQKIMYPDGRVLTYWYFNDGTNAPLLKSITRSDGLQLKYAYSPLASGDYVLSTVTAINNAIEYCSPTSACTLTKTWPTAHYSWTPGTGDGGILSVTDSAGRVTRYTEDANGRTTGIKLPSSSSSDNFTYTFCDGNCPQYAFEGPNGVQYQNYVLKVVRDGHIWNYTGNPNTGATDGSCAVATYGFTNPVGVGKQAKLDNCLATEGIGPPAIGFISLTDENGMVTNGPGYPYIGSDVKPEGNQTTYDWDVRGNLASEAQIPKAGSPLSQLALTANYDTTCTNAFTCNKPHSIKDALGNETDYTYDPSHGGILTMTSPADSTGIRPQTRYTYSQKYAWVLNSSGSYVQSAAPIWVLTTESFCRTSAATSTGCTVATDQVVKTYEYGPNSGPNNLFLRGFSVSADGATHRTCYGYDRMGNRISETQPSAALASCP